MVSDDVMHKYEWNPWYREIQEYGCTFINDEAAAVNAAKTPDAHIVFHRIGADQVPEFIQRNLSWLPIQHLQVFAIMANSTGMVHKDGIDRKCGLNIPLRDCGKGIMEWFTHPFEGHGFSSKATISRITKEEVANYPLRWQSEGQIRTIVERPTLVNTDVWHRVDNRDNPNHRYVLSIRFKDNPSFEEVHSHLKASS